MRADRFHIPPLASAGAVFTQRMPVHSAFYIRSDVRVSKTQCLNVFTSKISASFKIHKIFHYISILFFLQIVEVLIHFVMLLTYTAILNKGILD